MRRQFFSDDLKGKSLKFIVLLGIVSLLADVTYEGARSITGPFLSILGASGAAVGLIVGIGELVGYSLRAVSGYFADKTKQYWTITFIGYFINLFSVPLLALAGNWKIAALLIILERFGKAIRVPARDAMLSFATKQTGRGWGFGLHEALDQIGAVLGPLLMAAVLLFKQNYRLGFALLLIPALLALIMLYISKRSFPNPREMEVETLSLKTEGLGKTFWIYVIALGLVGAGYVDFAMIAYHFQKAALVSPSWIPFFYCIAMAVDGIAALIMGKLFDVRGLGVLIVITVLASLFAPFVFLGNFTVILIGVILWGIGMGAQESIMRSFVAVLVHPDKRGSAYGMMNLIFGICWAIGSALMGVLYDFSPVALVIFSMIAQLASVPFFLKIKFARGT